MSYINKDLRKLTLLLSQTKGVGPKTFFNIVEGVSDLNDMLDKLANFASKINLDLKNRSYESMLIEKEIDFVCIWEDTFSENLKNMADPPIILFYKGHYNKTKLDNSISVVGTRNITYYGKKHTNTLTTELTNRGYSIVSGMALGVDREAHLSCINSGGYTVAVLASSPENATPQTNSDVYRNILSNNGLILSESFPGTTISPGLFPRRNRIVAGLSLGTVVIEAGEKSGALITASLALNYNREVFALPGNVDNPMSKGTNYLIRDNRAKLIQDCNDILIEFGHLQNFDKESNLKKKNLSFEEDEIYNTILSEAKLADEISIKLNKSIQEVLSICSILEVKGLISKDISGKYYIN